MYVTNRQFWIDTAERALKTAAQTAAALIGTSAVHIIDLDWAQIGGVVATAVVLSVLTSLASDKVGAPGASAVAGALEAKATPVPPPPPLPALPQADPWAAPVFTNWEAKQYPEPEPNIVPGDN